MGIKERSNLEKFALICVICPAALALIGWLISRFTN